MLKAEEKALRALDASSRASVRTAVIVLRDEDKPPPARISGRRSSFPSTRRKASNIRTSSFSDGLGNRAVYAELCRDVARPISRARNSITAAAKDKADKSLELNKFYVNALYVAMTRAMEGLAVVETDVRHPLLRLARARGSRGDRDGPRLQASSKDEWAQEARKLELQGKQEQARAIRETFLAAGPRRGPRGLCSPSGMDAQGARSQKSFREDQAKHARLRAVAWTRRLYREAGRSQVRAALPLTHRRRVAGPRRQDDVRRQFVNPSKDPASPNDPKNPMGRATRAVAAMRERQLRPYLERSPKAILQDCGLYGVDHRPIAARRL